MSDMTPMGQPLLEVRHLSKNFGPVQALNDLIIATWPSNYVDVATVLGRDNSLRSDGLHPLAAGYALVAAAVKSKIVAEGW